MSMQQLNKHLMWQLDRLSSISDEELESTIESETMRARAICGVVEKSLNIVDRVIKVQELSIELGSTPETILGIGNEK